MIKKTFKLWKLQCANEECEGHGKLVEKHQWSDDPIGNCKKCKEPLIHYTNANPSFFIPKFAKLSPEGKRAVLKERSNKHFKTHIEEKKRWMDNN